MPAHPRSILVRGTLLLALLLATGGCATAQRAPEPGDPWEGFNRGVHQFNKTFDEVLLKPVAKIYQAVTPDMVDKGVSNFFSNLTDFIVAANNLLQFKAEDGLSDLSRILINSTFGLGGLVDVASSLGLRKHQEDFGQTLGVWGLPSGPYVVLPFLGPSTVRDGLGIAGDLQIAVAWNVDDMRTRNQLVGLRVVDERADLLATTRIVEEAALDEYSFIRDAYLQRRRFLLYDGNPPVENFEDWD